MEWFPGTIADAIASSKTRSCLFVVFVEDGEETSQKMIDRVWNSSTVREFMSDHVTLKLSAGSVTLNQFSQLYVVSSYPTTFFITPFGGRIVDVIVGAIPEEELVQRARSAHQKLCGPEKAPSTETSPAKPAGSEESASSASAAAPQKTLSKEEKIAKARALIAAQGEKREETSRQKERKSEVERREASRSAQDFLRKQEQQAAAQRMAEWRKEKEEAQKAREEIRKKIAQDRADKIARKEKESAAASAVPAAASTRQASKPSVASDESCIQFRLPDGSSITETFSSAVTLQTIREFVSRNVADRWPLFKLVVSYPRQELSHEQNDQSLAQLGLSPRAAVMVIAEQSGARSPARQQGSSLSGFWQVLFMPLLFLQAIWQWLMSTGTPPPRSSQSPQQQQQGASRSSRGGMSTYQEGRIRRLKTDDSDDDMNTWNGNSTQQQ